MLSLQFIVIGLLGSQFGCFMTFTIYKFSGCNLILLSPGMANFEPSERDVRVFNSTGQYRVCEEVIRWGASGDCPAGPAAAGQARARSSAAEKTWATAPKLLVIERSSQLLVRKFLQENSLWIIKLLTTGIGGLSLLAAKSCLGCNKGLQKTGCPAEAPCKSGGRGARCCRPVHLGRTRRVLACPYRC